MRADVLWKVFAFLVAGSVLLDAMSLKESSVVGVSVLLFKAVAVLGLFGFAWNRALLNQKTWKVVVVMQLASLLLLLGQVLVGLFRFSDPALFVAVLQALLVTGVISGFTLIGLFLYAWSPSLWASESDRPVPDNQ